MSTPGILVDTGPLVALLVRGEAHHEWAAAVATQLEPPLYTCDAVLVETCHLVTRLSGNPAPVLEMVERGLVRLHFSLHDEFEPVRKLMHRYRDVPMSLADACLVRMSELHTGARIFTLDSDFRIYRRLGRQAIPQIAP